MEQAEPKRGSKNQRCSPSAVPPRVLPGVGARARCVHRPLGSRISRTACRLFWEVVMGTVRCRYPSPWAPLLARHGDSEWRVGAACAISRARQGGHGQLQSRNAWGCWQQPGAEVLCASTPLLQGPEFSRGPRLGDRAGRWAQALREQRGTASAPAAALPAHSHGEPALPVLPRPTHPARSQQLLPQLFGGF